MISKDGNYRNCPFCGKEINTASLLCPSCNKDVSVFIPSIRIHAHNIRHKAIKTLMDLDPGIFDSYSKLNLALRGESKILVEGISFAQGARVKEALKKINIEADVKPIQFIKESSSQDSVTESGAPKKLVDSIMWIAILAVAAVLFYKYLLPNLKDDAKNSPTSQGSEMQKEQKPSSEDIEENISKLVSATVVIKGNKGSGSGFMITQDGYIITNNHVIANQYSLSVRMEDGRTFTPQVIKTDPSLDLALLKIDSYGLKTLKIGDATRMKAGYDVWTIGAPKELAFTVNKGIISYVGRNINGIKYLQSDVAINPGNSGGPMINSKGEVIGINTFMLTDSEGLNFALPINYTYTGEDPMLAALPNTPVETKREEFMPGEDERITAVFDEPKKAAPRSRPLSKGQSPSTYQVMMQELNERYERKRMDLESEKEALNSAKSGIQERLANDIDQIEISEENRLADRITDIDIQIANKDIEILEARLDYNNKAIRILNQAVNMSSGQSDTASLEQQIAVTKDEIRELTDQIKGLRARIANLKSSRTGF